MFCHRCRDVIAYFVWNQSRLLPKFRYLKLLDSFVSIETQLLTFQTLRTLFKEMSKTPKSDGLMTRKRDSCPSNKFAFYCLMVLSGDGSRLLIFVTSTCIYSISQFRVMYEWREYARHNLYLLLKGPTILLAHAFLLHSDEYPTWSFH